MAEVYGFGDGDVSLGEAAAQGGVIFAFGSDAQSGSLDSFQYRRGTSAELYQGIHKISSDSQGLKSGVGNAIYDLCSPEILDAIANRSGAELVRRGWQDADHIDWQAIHTALTTNHYPLVADNCILITDEEYFQDDIVGRFVEFVRVVYGDETLEANLDFIAKALGNKGKNSREVIRNYFLGDFIKAHNKTYQKRPIYWLFDSGKQNGFKALVYMHRWHADTIGHVRVEYLHRLQRVYESEIKRMQEACDQSTNGKAVSVARKRLEKLQKQLKETKDYDTRINHLALLRIDIDLDDGVKVNYDKVQTAPDGKQMAILAKI